MSSFPFRLSVTSMIEANQSKIVFCQNTPDDISGKWTDGGTNFFLAFCVDCPGDITGDLFVGVLDLLALLAVWGPCDDCFEDLDESGAVDIIDLLILLGAWGPCI